MKKTHQPTKRQHQFIDALITHKCDEQTILAEHKISRATYQKWLAEPAFLEQFELRREMAHHRSRAIIAHHAHEAAERLFTLTTEGKGETARKACLDIISMAGNPTTDPVTPPQVDKPADSPQIPPDTAARILAELAHERDRTETDE